MALIQRDSKCPVFGIAILAVALAAVSGPLDEQRARLIAQRQPVLPPPAFEVAILKPNTNSGVGVTGGCQGIDSKFGTNDQRVTVPLGRCVIRAAALRHLMTIAFDLPIDRISGLPEWDRSNRFDVEAVAEDPSATSEPQLLSMLQQFLIDEFSLKVRREQKEGPTFSLVVARSGPRNLHPSGDSGCLTSIAKVATFALKGCTMQDLASLLSSMPPVQRPVIDKTLLAGRFDFVVEAGSRAQDIADLKAAMAQWETLFSDLQEQLGLRLERSTGSVETLVIDHVELPHQK